MKNHKFIDTTPSFESIPKLINATIMPSGERVQVIEGSETQIYSGTFVKAISNGRIGMYNKESVVETHD